RCTLQRYDLYVRIPRIIGRNRPAISGRRRRNTSRLVPNNQCGRYRKRAEIGRTKTRKQSKHERNTNQHANDTGAKASARLDRDRVQPENILKSDEEAGILRRPPCCCCCSAGDLSADQESSETMLLRNESLSDELSVSVSVAGGDNAADLSVAPNRSWRMRWMLAPALESKLSADASLAVEELLADSGNA
ncbi:unnamed protein product, partial [Mycena citricolor]